MSELEHTLLSIALVIVGIAWLDLQSRLHKLEQNERLNNLERYKEWVKK